MTRTTIFTLGAAALALALTPTHADARPQGRPQGPPPPLAQVIERHADELGLDAATLDEVTALQERQREQTGEVRESIREARESLRSLMDSDEPDEAAVVSQVEALGALQTQARIARVRSDLTVRNLLTSQQLATLRSLRPERPQGGERGRPSFDRQGSGGTRDDSTRPQRGGFQRSR